MGNFAIVLKLFFCVLSVHKVWLHLLYHDLPITVPRNEGNDYSSWSYDKAIEISTIYTLHMMPMQINVD